MRASSRCRFVGYFLGTRGIREYIYGVPTTSIWRCSGEGERVQRRWVWYRRMVAEVSLYRGITSRRDIFCTIMNSPPHHLLAPFILSPFLLYTVWRGWRRIAAKTLQLFFLLVRLALFPAISKHLSYRTRVSTPCTLLAAFFVRELII